MKKGYKDLEIKKVSVLTLGCCKNIVDSENLIGMLKENNLVYETDLNNADLLIINTCGFIKPAKEESINIIMQAVSLRKKGNLKRLYVMGCLSQRYKDDLRKQIPEVDAFFGVNSSMEIIKHINDNLEINCNTRRHLLTPNHYAYLKISDGCNHRCSFCAIPLIKGNYSSTPIENIINEAKSLINQGVKELIVIAQDTTYYGVDLYGKRVLHELLQRISDIDGVEWIRLMYTYPQGFPKEVLKVIAERDNICKYIDIPLQHISDKILKSMKRGISRNQTEELINDIRSIVPEIAIRTAFIVGFPNETEDDFQELMDFVYKQKFERVGVFNYSSEEGTTAFDLTNLNEEDIIQNRRNSLMEMQSEIALDNNRKLIGKKIKILLDEVNNKVYSGRTQWDAPDVDNGVLIEPKKKINIGQFYNIDIYDASEYDLFGRLK